MFRKKNAVILLPLSDKENNWHNAAEFTRIMKREIARSYRSELPLSYLIIDISEYIELKINLFNRKKIKYDRFLNILIELINKNTREIDIKCIKNFTQIDILLINTDIEGASDYIAKMKKVLKSQMNLSRMKNFKEIIKSVKILHYPLNQLTGRDEINISSSLKIQIKKEQNNINTLRNYNLKYSSIKNGFYNPILSISGGTLAIVQTEFSFQYLLKNINNIFDYNTIKRFMDILGSIAGIIMFGPVMIVIAILVRISSRGPILFKQKRLGYLGKEFTFLKFRSMRMGIDDHIHQEYVKKLIAGKCDEVNMGTKDKPIYKIVNDPRVTKLGAFIRKTSLDELPQFFNVLLGDMSLVGPRPPIPYEVDSYKNWHTKRIAEVKPGITGMWQAYGRSETSFDDMVRYDIQYVNNQSVWLDIKIILATIITVFKFKGAM